MNPRDFTRSSRIAPVIGRRLLVAGVLALVITACSGDDDTSPATTIAPSTTESAPTTVATTPPTAPETTPPVPETTPPTLPAEPTTTATSAPPHETQIKQDVIDAAQAAWTAFNELLLDPENDDKVATVGTVLTDKALERAIEIAVSYRANDQAERTHPQHPAGVQVDEDSVVVDSVTATATVEYCRLGSNVWVEVASNPDGSDRVLDDTISSYRERDSFSLIDGRWMKVSGVTVTKHDGELECPPGG